jgi:hypothetical protein
LKWRATLAAKVLNLFLPLIESKWIHLAEVFLISRPTGTESKPRKHKANTYNLNQGKPEAYRLLNASITNTFVTLFETLLARSKWAC